MAKQAISALLGHAFDYAHRGLEVFPVNERTKAPHTSQLQATCDLEVIEGWWRQWPSALIGHRISPMQIILDVDPRHGGLDTWRALLAEMPAFETRVHYSGRGDGGGHVWFQRPADRLSVTKLDEWAREHGTGHEVEGSTRWSSGIDLLRHEHRYTILPPSPHPETGAPYAWRGAGVEVEVAPLPQLLCDLLVADEPPALPLDQPRRQSDSRSSIADWYSEVMMWSTLLARHGWTLVAGDGNGDRSRWRHPRATSTYSATIRHGCLFVYSPNTPFEPTATGDAHGYTKFAAYAVLEHGGDQREAGRAARMLKDGAPAPNGNARVIDLRPSSSSSPQDEPEALVMAAGRPFERVGLDVASKPDPRPTVGRYLYRGGLTILQAEPGVGKSWLALDVALDVMRSGGVALYLDEEGGEDLVRERLYALKAAPEMIEALFWYFPFEARSWGDDDVVALRQMVDDAKRAGPVEVAVLDSLPDFLAAAGLSEDKAQDVTTFVNKVCATLRNAGVAQLALDHLRKPLEAKKGGKGERSRYSRGSGSKLAKADATILLEAIEQFDTTRSGRLRVWKTKDRLGRLDAPNLHDPARIIEVNVDDGHIELVDGKEQRWEGPTECMEKVLGLMEPGLELSTRQIRGLLDFRSGTVQEALERLVVSRQLHVRNGPNRSLLYSRGGTVQSSLPVADEGEIDEEEDDYGLL